MSNILKATMLIGTIGFLASCQTAIPVQVDRGALVTPKVPANITVNLLSRAKDIRSAGVDQVGRHTITLLMIPGPTVTTEREHLDEAISNQVREALEVSGVTVTLVDKLDQAKGPVVVVQIDKLRNYLFSWLYPLGLVFGGMELSLHLMSPDGKTLWTANMEGHGGMMASLFYMSGFESRVTSDLTANVNQIIQALASEQFRAELQKARSL